MEHATLVTIPTIVHLMRATDSKTPGDQHNKDVSNTRGVFPKILASADDSEGRRTGSGRPLSGGDSPLFSNEGVFGTIGAFSPCVLSGSAL